MSDDPERRKSFSVLRELLQVRLGIKLTDEK